MMADSRGMPFDLMVNKVFMRDENRKEKGMIEGNNNEPIKNGKWKHDWHDIHYSVLAT